jgi:NTE family protein
MTKAVSRSDRPGRPGIGIALGGGGARGMAHYGVLGELRRDPQSAPGIIAGCSAGAVAGSLYAARLDQPTIEQVAVEFDWFRDVVEIGDTVRSLFERGHPGLMSNNRLAERINARIGGRSFDELPKDLAVVASDIANNQRVIFTSRRVAERIDWDTLYNFLPRPERWRPGFETRVISDFPDVGRAVQASATVPAFFRPVEIRDMKLIDGGAMDVLPVDIVQSMGAEVTIGISLGLAALPERVRSTYGVISWQLGTLGIHQLRRSLAAADVGFEITGIASRSPVKAGQTDLMDQGAEDMRTHMPALKRAVRAHRFPFLGSGRLRRAVPLKRGV